MIKLVLFVSVSDYTDDIVAFLRRRALQELCVMFTHVMFDFRETWGSFLLSYLCHLVC